MLRQETPKLVVVRWSDSTSADVQATAEQAEREQLIIMESAGHLVFRDSEKICIATDWIEASRQFRHFTWIPLVNVIEVRQADSVAVQSKGKRSRKMQFS